MAEQPSPPARMTVADLRRMWEQGHRSQAIRAALERWNSLLNANSDLHWLITALRTSGLPVEAFALQARTARRTADWEVLIRGLVQRGDPWWARTLLREVGEDSRELQRLRIEVELVFGSAADRIAKWTAAYDDEDARAAAVDWWVRSGQIDKAEQIVAQSAGLHVWRARFALWRRDPVTARRSLIGATPSAKTQCVEAVIAVQEQRWAEAESQLTALLESNVRAEAGSWLAYVLRKQGRYADAMRAADAADGASPVFNLATRLERQLASEYERMAQSPAPRRGLLARLWRSRGTDRPRMRTIGDLEHVAALAALGACPHDSIATLEGLIESFAGNRTPYTTTFAEGVLTAHLPPVDPRHFGAAIQLVLWTRGADAVRALYDEYAPSVEHHPFFTIYRGETELWLGHYDRAAQIFAEVLKKDQTVKWAWIGLGASAMLQGNYAEAQQTWEKGLSITGFAGPTLYVYRGECFRRQGDVSQARRELEIALQQKPQRLSAQINMALLEGEPEALARVERACIAHAPILMEQLIGNTCERLEKVLEAMRGNRSSAPSHVSYHLWGRVWGKATA